MKRVLAQWRASFFAGLAIVLPAVISIALMIWLFGTVSVITDTLLFFLPTTLTHQRNGEGPMYWYWSVLAFLLAAFLIGLVGQLARHYIGKKLIQWVDLTLLRVPLLNKIYGTIKQVNEAFTSNRKSAFKQVVLVEFPHAGYYSVGFLTGDQHPEAELKTGKKIVCVFVPTTPNPTSGFLVLVPESEVTKMDMSVAEGIKFIISLGSIAPEFLPQPIELSPVAPGPLPIPYAHFPSNPPTAIGHPQSPVTHPQSVS